MNGINRTRSLAEFARSIFLPFLTVALTTLGARAQAPDWKVDPAAFESSMTIVGTVYVGGNQSSGSGDVLAAFVGNEVRGVAHPLLAGEQLFFMVVYANAEADTLRFRMYDSIGDQIVDLRETLIFTPDGTAGSPSAPLVFNEERAAGANMPDWTVTPSQFESSMGIVGTVATDETPSIEDRLAVFVNGEIRGVNQPVLIGGAALFFLTVYGDTPGDTLSFRLYDADYDAISGLQENVLFEVDGIVGTVAQPMQLTEHSGAGSNIPDWSVNPAAYENTMSIVAALFTDGVRSSRAGDIVAAFSGPDVRGVGTAKDVASQTLFFLTVYGRSSESLTFKAYNSGADEVQDLEQEISFVPDAILGSVSQPLVVSTPSESGSGVNRPDWTVVPARYSLSMNVIGVLSLEGATSGNDSDMIGAYVGEEIRGVVSPILVGGQSLFFLTIYANASGEPITFRAYDASRDRVRGVGDPITFVPDAITGSIDRPYVWSDAAGAQRPKWEPDSTAFSSVMTVIATIMINGEPSTHPENLISARAGDVVRGSAGPTRIDGQTLFAMRVFADNDGEVLSVEAYDGALDKLRPVDETITFTAGTTLGSSASPFVLTTLPDPPQAAPILLAPGDLAVDIPLLPELLWEAVPRAEGYEVQIGTASDFSNAATYEAMETAIVIPNPLQQATIYYWHVRSANAGGRGPWSLTRTFTTVRSPVGVEDGPVPRKTAIFQNYPNPVDHSTAIEYQLAAGSQVQLVVHDALGRLVTTLVNQYQSAGKHRATLDARSLANGLYVYRLQTAELTSTRSMLVLR